MDQHGQPSSDSSPEWGSGAGHGSQGAGGTGNQGSGYSGASGGILIGKDAYGTAETEEGAYSAGPAGGGVGGEEVAGRKLGRFEVRAILGRGGMGEVLRAYDPERSQEVALKVLLAEGLEDPELRKRFEREAQAATDIVHPNLAQFYGLEHDDQGHPILVMEYIEGLPLDKVIKTQPDITLSRALHFVIQAARGLDAARRRSLIHRDMKPANLIVMSDDRVKVIDFGLAKGLWDQTHLTGTGMVVGTPRYISPEQGLGRSVDHRSDIYSLGATLYELVCRQTPFDGDTPASIMLKHVNSPLTPPYMINPKCPADISDIIVRMLAKDPKDRYQEYDEVIRDLEQARQHQLSKERRQDMRRGHMPTSEASTILLNEAASSGDDIDSATGLPRRRKSPSPYLTEGLVDVDFAPRLEPVPDNTITRYAIVGLALVLIGGAIYAATRQQVDAAGNKQPSWISATVSKLVAKATGQKSEERSPEEIALDDYKKLETTKRRMDNLSIKVVEYKKTHPASEFPRINALREAGVLTSDEIKDGYGNDIYLVSSQGGILVSRGRDGTDDTDDDFRFWIDGSKDKIIPKPLKVEDIIVQRDGK